MIKNIIFDLGNVLVRFKPNEFLLKFTRDQKYIDQFLSKVTRSKVWLELDRGKISLENAKKMFVARYPLEKDFTEQFFDQWMDMLTPIDENVAILKELKEQGYKTYILSNYIKEAFDYCVSKHTFFSLFDGQIISGIENINKPDRAIYELLINRFELNPEKSLFIDDVLYFLKPAKKLGMKTIWNRPETDLKEELKKFDISL
ncbi:MAG: HAD family hydrolase [Promethearchaeota archaeon]|jgi:putative hydrolase of the HAD superfamily